MCKSCDTTNVLAVMVMLTQDTDLASQVDACQHDVLRIMVKAAELQVEAFEEKQRRSGNFVWEGERLADLLHFALIIFA